MITKKIGILNRKTTPDFEHDISSAISSQLVRKTTIMFQAGSAQNTI